MMENRTKVVYACKNLSPDPKSEQVLSGIYCFAKLLDNVFLIMFHLKEIFRYGIHEVEDSSVIFLFQITVSCLVEFLLFL